MLDTYSKLVLSVIALSLVVLAVQIGLPRVNAQDVTYQCGWAEKPCYVTTDHPLPVRQ